jgi:DNA-binding MarR family transcriptional regulator
VNWRDPKDRRAHLIVLTNRAKPLVGRIRTAIRSMMVDVLREVPGEERASMLRNPQQNKQKSFIRTRGRLAGTNAACQFNGPIGSLAARFAESLSRIFCWMSRCREGDSRS